ncbi:MULTISPECIES: hypothetical protein [Cytobacillus]|uniref:hypothetical protein n=1 Tax=Cytobacillus TaxID=2675230 RepID=UPI001CD81A3B|nr:hypothetical protein [Cytobacillus kochii]MCA1029040.1 hypothetical protein [Cytobacillus kochii]MDM5205985.1 hypothetical protein [Cytobacillus kochii]
MVFWYPFYAHHANFQTEGEGVRESERLALLGGALSAIGSIIVVIGLFDQLEEDEEGITESESEGILSLESFRLALLGSIIVAAGESIGTVSIIRGIKEDEIISREEEREKNLVKTNMTNMQTQLQYMQEELNQLKNITSTLQQENYQMRTELYHFYRYLQIK